LRKKWENTKFSHNFSTARWVRTVFFYISTWQPISDHYETLRKYIARGDFSFDNVKKYLVSEVSHDSAQETGMWVFPRKWLIFSNYLFDCDQLTINDWMYEILSTLSCVQNAALHIWMGLLQIL